MEDDWKIYKKCDEKKDEALILKGLINGATSLALYRLNRSQRAKDVTWNAFLKYGKLIEKIDSKFKEKYKEAQKLLNSKYTHITKG